MPIDREHEPDDWARVARHLAGEMTQDDAEEMRRWLAADATRARVADEARSTWHATSPAVELAAAQRAVAATETNDSWSRLASRIALGDDTAHTASRTPIATRTAASVRWARRAAVTGALVAAAAAVAVFVRVPQADSTNYTWRSYAASPGERASIHLPDGSRADLRPNSTLRVAVANGRHAAPRLVELEGEALFTVVHDSARPFVVRAGTATVEDLGTVFDVRAYAHDTTVRVVVAEGAVSVRPAARDARATVLARGDVATLDGAGSVSVVRVDDPLEYLAWARDRFAFRDQPLREVAADLGRAFDARVVVPDSTLAARRVTIDMPVRTLDSALGALATLFDLEVRPTGDSVLLVPARAPMR